MKKFLLSLATVALVGSASAETVTDVLKITDFITNGKETTYQDVTYTSPTTGITYSANVALANATYHNGFQFRSSGSTSGLCVQENPDNLELKSINFTWADGTAVSRKLDFYYKDTAYEAPKELYNNATRGTSLGSISFSATPETLNVENSGVLYWALRSNNGALYLEPQITIVYEKEDADDRKPAEIAFDNTEYSVGSNQQYFTGATLSNPNNLPVTYTSSDETVASVTAQGIKVNGVGTTTITATFEGNDEYRPATVSYTLTVANTVSTIAQMINLANNTEVIVGCELMVGFVNYSNVFVTDGEEWIQIYGTNEYKTGDIIPAGWAAKYTLYSNVTPELMPVAALPASSTNMAAFLEYPTLGVPTAADVNKVAYFHVTFDEATPSTKTNFTGVINGTEVTFRNNYTIEGVPAGEYTDVLAVVVVYQGNAQLYVVSYEKEKAPEAVYPESLEIASDAALNIVQNGTDITITGESATDEFTVTLGIPEGWDGWLIQGDFTNAEVSPLAKVAPAEWYPVDMMTQYGFYKANSFTIEADNVKNYISAYLYKDDQVDMANGYDISVKVAKSTIVGVEEIEAAEAAAEYYTLQGVKVANPENGVYVKVCGGKAEKVVIK